MISRDYLEYGMVEHCNLKCKGCSVFAPYLAPHFTEIESFKRDLTALATAIKVKRLRLLGGEPLLHKQIVDYIKVAKETKIARQVHICTNGELIPRMGDDFFSVVDQVDVSIYRDTRINYFDVQAFLDEKQKSHKFKVRWIRHKTHFTVINLDKAIEDEAQVQKIYDTCAIAHSWSCHQFNDGYYYKCAKPIYQNKYFEHAGVKTDINYAIVDGLAIHEPNLEERLKAYLEDKKPLAACKLCMGTNGPQFKHRQLTKNEIDTAQLDETLDR